MKSYEYEYLSHLIMLIEMLIEKKVSQRGQHCPLKHLATDSEHRTVGDKEAEE